MAYLRTITILFTLLSSQIYCTVVFATPPQVTNIAVTDVTPVSFSVIWASNVPSTSNINIFADENGLVPVSDISIESQPVENNNSAIVQAAEDNGVMKVRVRGLSPDSDFYFQTVTTSKSPVEQTLFPATAPMLSVKTARVIIKSSVIGSQEIPFTNDLIAFDCGMAGALLIADVGGSDHPVTGFAGDGVSGQQAYIDLNNTFRLGNSMPLNGGELVTLTKFKGIQGIESQDYYIPKNDQLTQIKFPLDTPLCEGDVDGDGDFDGNDLASFVADFGNPNCGSVPLCKGDFDRDGDVDLFNLDFLSADFGRTDCP